jgi:hypothetical protein
MQQAERVDTSSTELSGWCHINERAVAELLLKTICLCCSSLLQELLRPAADPTMQPVAA